MNSWPTVMAQKPKKTPKKGWFHGLWETGFFSHLKPWDFDPPPPRDTCHDFYWVIVLKRFVWLQRTFHFLQIDPKSSRTILAPETLKQGFLEVHKENPDFCQFWTFFTYFTTPRKLSGQSTSNFLETCTLIVPNYCENFSP